MSTADLTAPAPDDASRVASLLTEVPTKLSLLSEDGINDVIDVVQAHPGRAKAVATALRTDPRLVIQTAFRLTMPQRRALRRVDDADLQELTASIADAFDSGQAIFVRAAEPGGEEFLESRMPVHLQVKIACLTFIVIIEP